MASIDRYRPPREGYQPPILPGASRSDEPQRSSPHPREVPPPASTPPQHSTRASTPRPQGTKSSSQPSSGSQYNRNGPAAAIHQWSFTSEEVESSPSIIDGLSPSEERLRRAKGVNFIYQAGVMLDLPQITLWVAGVFFHRFYMRFSMVQEKGGIHHYVSIQSPRLSDDYARSAMPNEAICGRNCVTDLLYLTEYCCHCPLSCEQSRRKLPKNKGDYYSSC